MKILIVEDEIDVTKVLRKRLMDHGFEVISAEDVIQGVQLAHEEKPDLIVLDLKLPAGGGLNLLKDIRMSSRTKYIPVIVLTGLKDAYYKNAIMKEGVDAYLEKPYDSAELLKVIDEVLKKE